MVLVSLEPAGIQALEDFRSQLTALLRADLATTTDEQIEALAAATETLESLINLLQQPRRTAQTRGGQDRSTPVR
jgi:Zn-dependent oligopeptidase